MNLLTLHDCLSIQTDDVGLLDSIYSSRFCERSSLSRNGYSFSHDFDSPLLSSGATSLGVEPITIEPQRDGIKDIHLMKKEQSSNPNNSSLLDEGSIPSNKTLWDELSHDQMQRIRCRMKECFSQHPLQVSIDDPLVSNIISKPMEEKNNVEIDVPYNESIKDENKRVNCKDKVTNSEETILQDQLPCESNSTIAKKNTTTEAESSQEDISQDESYFSNIISQISEGLYTSIHAITNPNNSDDYTKRNSESSLLNDNTPIPISKPEHPFTLPLATGIKESIKRGKIQFLNTSQQ